MNLSVFFSMQNFFVFILRKLKPDITKNHSQNNPSFSATSTREDKKQDLLHPYYNHITSHLKYHEN